MSLHFEPVWQIASKLFTNKTTFGLWDLLVIFFMS